MSNATARLRGQIELMAKLMGHLDDSDEVNVCTTVPVRSEGGNTSSKEALAGEHMAGILLAVGAKFVISTCVRVVHAAFLEANVVVTANLVGAKGTDQGPHRRHRPRVPGCGTYRVAPLVLGWLPEIVKSLGTNRQRVVMDAFIFALRREGTNPSPGRSYMETRYAEELRQRHQPITNGLEASAKYRCWTGILTANRLTR